MLHLPRLFLECMLFFISVHPRIYSHLSNIVRGDDCFNDSTIVQHEIELRVHAHLPVLADKSAASGLLWAKRQIHYQTLLFENISQIPFAFPSSKAAVRVKIEYGI
jgi:hypothetical protein